MRRRYDHNVTRYICDRTDCQNWIDVPSDTFYEFTGPEDSHFWCQWCDSEPSAKLLGIPAFDLPQNLSLPQQFILEPVPRISPSDDSDSANLMYRPYSKRSFLRQYINWLIGRGLERSCGFRSTVSRSKKFDIEFQCYTNETDYAIVDECDGSSCRFLRTATLRPIQRDDLICSVITALCSIKTNCGLCETGDEAEILRNYLLISGEDHFPMLIPQPSIKSGEKRPDFLCYIPITKFQYRPVAVLVDRPGKPQKATQKEDLIYRDQGFHVRRILVDKNVGFSYFKAARDLKNWIEHA